VEQEAVRYKMGKPVLLPDNFLVPGTFFNNNLSGNRLKLKVRGISGASVQFVAKPVIFGE
jgi:hypothetical protein